MNSVSVLSETEIACDNQLVIGCDTTRVNSTAPAGVLPSTSVAPSATLRVEVVISCRISAAAAPLRVVLEVVLVGVDLPVRVDVVVAVDVDVHVVAAPAGPRSP